MSAPANTGLTARADTRSSERRQLTLRIWRQAAPDRGGHFETYPINGLAPEMTLLEALDLLNERLVRDGAEPVAFDSDCREGICGACGIVVDGRPHGPLPRTTTCQIPVRAFPDGALVTLEPFATGVFPVLRDLMVDRRALDRVIAAGGYVSVRTGSAPEANGLPIAASIALRALDAAACIGCGACVAACPNGSASLFVGAKLRQLALLPQGQPERSRRTTALVAAADAVGFGGCTFHGECQAVCPQGIGLDVIAHANRDRLASAVDPEARLPIDARGAGRARSGGD